MARVIPDWVRKRSAARRAGYRSGLEDDLGKEIVAAGHPLVYEEHKVPYLVPEKRHLYTPDFLLANGILVEGKGIFDATDRAKHLFVREQYPELDIRFVFSSARAKIGPGSKTTLADWCEKYGFKYAHKHIPPEWFREKGPAIHPSILLKEGPYGYLKRDPNIAKTEALRRAGLKAPAK
ncbi:hypothetical protein [Mesorhizobium sp. WSM4982]|uniref:hypothetical protein n=1 Tax=Mesorhizobium sp. WSM4982 TaxID=3038550 RepID=UPI002414E59F|nr:hypothetical protein [Mesorhizobium sp. WSM4982]MDG4856404.1 hypothetical protein [Mesorhizobium sp. WSM4982]